MSQGPIMGNSIPGVPPDNDIDYWFYNDTELPGKPIFGPPVGQSSGPPTPVVLPAPNQDLTARALGLPQLLHCVVSYQGTLTPLMAVRPNELDQV